VVLYDARALPLAGIIEFFLCHTIKYFLKRANAVHIAMESWCIQPKLLSTWTKHRKGSSS
jgi:hypothetical protein